MKALLIKMFLIGLIVGAISYYFSNPPFFDFLTLIGYSIGQSIIYLLLGLFIGWIVSLFSKKILLTKSVWISWIVFIVVSMTGQVMWLIY